MEAVEEARGLLGSKLRNVSSEIDRTRESSSAICEPTSVLLTEGNMLKRGLKYELTWINGVVGLSSRGLESVMVAEIISPLGHVSNEKRE